MGKSSTGGLRAGPLHVRDFFVSRIQKEEGVEEVRAHMAGYNIMARDIVTKNNLNSKLNSFKLSLNVVDAEKFNNPDGWPVGVCVRRNKHKTMANKQLHITTYNYTHFYDSGDKFDFKNKLMCDSAFLF